MPVSLRVVTPPASPVVPLADAKAHLRVDHSADNDLITAMLVGALADAGQECGRGFGSATYALTLDAFPGGAWPAHPERLPLWPCWNASGLTAADLAVLLPVTPVASVDAVRYRDEDGTLVTMDAADYWLGARSGRLAPAAGYWPATQYGRPEAVEVEFTAGYEVADLPPQARDAVLLIVADRYYRRGDDDQAARPAIPDAARRLLWQLRERVDV